MHPSPQIIEGFGHPEGADKSRLYVEGQTVDVCRIGYRQGSSRKFLSLLILIFYAKNDIF